MTTSATEPWAETILAARDSETAWSGIFNRLRDVALATPTPQTLHHQTVDPARLLRDCQCTPRQAVPPHVATGIYPTKLTEASS